MDAILLNNGGGGITPEGSITITGNGIYDVTEYADAVVALSLSRTLLYSNSNTTSNFTTATFTPAQSVDDFQYLQYYFIPTLTETDQRYEIIRVSDLTTSLAYSVGICHGEWYQNAYYSYFRALYKSGNNLVIENCKRSVNANWNDHLIPVSIYGLKGINLEM